LERGAPGYHLIVALGPLRRLADASRATSKTISTYA
jgi:hypothetical protein